MTAPEKKFGRPEQLVDEVLKDVRVMSRLTDNGREINDFAITTRNCVAVLQEIDEEGRIHNPVLLKEILEKMTPLLRNQFAEYWMMKREEGRREAKLITLADFLEREAELAAVYARAAAASQLSAERALRRRETFKVNTQTEVATKCPKCASEHKLVACDAFKALSTDEKWDFVKREKLCFKCIMKTHPCAYCRAKGCAKCNRGHHTLLHSSASSDAHPAREIKVHTLLDDGATVRLLDDSVASEINAKGPRVELKLISGRGHQISDRNSRRVKIKVRGPNGVERDIQCRTIARLDLPSQSLTADEISGHRHLSECHLEALHDARPLLFIGQDNWELIKGSDVQRRKSGEPVASLTGFGWVVLGRRSVATTNYGVVHCLADLELAVKEYFEIESLGITQRERENAEVKRASRILNDTTRRIGNNWETDLFWKEDDPRFPDNYSGAKKQLRNIENKMDRDPAFAATYTAQIERLIENGYARPDLLNSLIGVLFRFRIGSEALTGDIKYMFLRIRVRASDQRAQLFLWRGVDRDSEPCVFGASSSPTSAIYVLNRNAETHSDEYPNAEIAGWTTNAPELKERLLAESSTDATTVSLYKTKTERALGVIWEPECDSLGYDVTFKNIVVGKNRPVKTQFLSLILSIFDPLGLLCPVTVKGKILMQRIWRSEIGWDDVLLDRDYIKWLEYLDKVNSADNPADVVTRVNSDLERWLNGPAFLLQNEDAWPIDSDELETESVNIVCTTHTGDVIDVTRFSSWTRLVRTYARVLCLIRKLRKQQRPFDADDVVDAETRLLRASQKRAFNSKIRAAAMGATTSRGSSLKTLDVMLTDGWLRAGGRLRHSMALSYKEKQLIILDGRDHAVRLLVEHYHR
ncbi:hypothetical protein EVAR_101852_1 [Eumeta japonica]|uniref:Peptidase aspartic putative domain-containing protein n=1 Tax=Eumeta variegata TaxID=151549 RepID=A0A4C1SR32_EUMVA|nr:hypothetical protein EVAR_101852_1 [Eumeta japonica]